MMKIAFASKNLFGFGLFIIQFGFCLLIIDDRFTFEFTSV